MPMVLHGRSVLSDVDSNGGDRSISWVIYLIVLASLILGVVWWQTQGTFKFSKDQPVASLESELPPPLPDREEVAAHLPGSNASASLATRVRDSAVLSPSAQELPNSALTQAVATTSPPAMIQPAGAVISSTPATLADAPTKTLLPVEQITATAKPVDTPKQQPSALTLDTQPDKVPVNAAVPTVVLNLTAKSWVDITDAEGNRLVYKLLPAGTSKTLKDLKLPLKVVLGNPVGVRLEYNGQPFDYSRYSHDGITRFELGSANHSAAQNQTTKINLQN